MQKLASIAPLDSLIQAARAKHSPDARTVRLAEKVGQSADDPARRVEKAGSAGRAWVKMVPELA
ncbi:MAG: hypothetical protein WBM40_17295, partial [Thiohalocapsa sp.]